jgi:hypothetical protein
MMPKKTFFTEHQVEKDKHQSTVSIHVVDTNQDQEVATSDPNVAAFRPQQQQQQFRAQQSGYYNWGNRSRGQGSYPGNSNNRSMQNKGSYAARNGKFWIHCKILNHTQEECRKRINENKSCVNGKGQL